MSRTRRNLIWLLVSQTATWVVSFALLAIAPSLIPADAFGALAFATTFVSYFSLVAGLETATLLTREIARTPDLVGEYVRNGLTMKSVVAVALSSLALGASVATGMDSLTVKLVACGCVGMILSNLNSVIQGALAGLHRVARAAMWTVVQLYAGAAFGLTALFLGGDVVTFAAVSALAWIIPLVANYLTVRHEVRGSWRPDFGTWRRLVGGGLPLLTLSGLVLFYGSIDIPILNWLAGDAAVGWYALAYRWAGIPLFICTAVVGAYFPVFSQHGGTQGPEFAGAVNRAIMLVVFISAPAAFGLASIADDVIHTFAPAEYADAIPILRILVLQIPIAAVDTIMGTAMVASNRLREYLWVPAGAAVLTPLVLIVVLWNQSPEAATITAALVTTGTEIYVFVGLWRLRARGVLDRTTTSRCVRAIAAAALIVPVLWLLDRLPFPVLIPIAALVYSISVIGFRVVRLGELWDLRHGLGSLLRPGGGGAMVGAPPIAETDESR